MKYLALALIPIVVACLAASVDPLDGYFIMQSNGIPSMSGVYRQGHGEYHLTNWLSVTSSSSPRVITTILKAPRNAIAAKGQIWVGNSASYINIPEVNMHVGETNEGWTFSTYSTTNDWPQIASSTSLIFVRSLEKANAGRVEGQDYYARCLVRLWSDTAFVESEALLLLSCLTNNCTLLPNGNFHHLNLGGKASNYYVTNAWPPIPRYYNREVFIGGESAGPTNIVINNGYSVTIQIGTNFATVKELDTWMQVLGEMKRGDESLIKVANAHPSVTYTVDVANGLWKHTNVVEIHKCSEFCTRMRYVDDGLTNDFHTAFTGYTVKTNVAALSITNTTEQVIQDLEVVTEKFHKATTRRNQHIRDFAYFSALAGYCAATNGVPFERISNHVEKICAEFFPAP